MQQVLFSEPALAHVKIQRYLAEAARHRADLVALDVVLNMATAYFDILLARTAGRIQDENLEASRRNLKIARTRHAVGYAGVADVFRWESEVARATQSSIQAFNSLYLAKVQLNRLLNRPDIGEEFEVEDAAPVRRPGRLRPGRYGGPDPPRRGRGDPDRVPRRRGPREHAFAETAGGQHESGRAPAADELPSVLPAFGGVAGAGGLHLLARRQRDAARFGGSPRCNLEPRPPLHLSPVPGQPAQGCRRPDGGSAAPAPPSGREPAATTLPSRPGAHDEPGFEGHQHTLRPGGRGQRPQELRAGAGRL